MPMYPCKCLSCGSEQEPILPLSEYKNLPECCGEQMTRVFTAPHVIEDMKPYRSVIDGSIVGSRKAHRDHLTKHGVIEVGNESLETKKPEPKDTVREDIIKTLHQHNVIG